MDCWSGEEEVEDGEKGVIDLGWYRDISGWDWAVFWAFGRGCSICLKM